MPEINAGDTAWMLVSTALVMLMTPGLGLLLRRPGSPQERSLDDHAQLLHPGADQRQWVLWGYILAFGPDTGLGIIGGLDWIGLKGSAAAPSPIYAPTIPHYAFMAFQMMFAIITPALITGAFAERKRFKAFVLFSLLWATLVYDPIAHWVWGAGRLAATGSARSTSPAARWSTIKSASRRWSPRSCSAAASAFGESRWSRTTPP